MPLSSGTRLGAYEILAPLGAGGMGEVYRARHVKLRREAAIKVLPTEFAADPERLRRFEREARAASALNHPAIVTIYDIGDHEGTTFIAMEMVEGVTLRQRLRDAPLETKEAVQLATSIADGLARAHAAGVVHRDLKPENVMIAEGGLVKILDFGLAKQIPTAAGEGADLTTMTQMTRHGAQWRITKQGFETFDGAPFGQTLRPFAQGIALDPEGSRPEGMVRVPGRPYLLDGFPPIELGDYWLDRYEVTNREFKAFVDAGGYEAEELWTEPFVEEGSEIPPSEAIARFVDATGRPGPAGWEVGTFGTGQEDFPVGGVSWYEAAAYCRSLGKSLPTIFHWSGATGQDQFSDIVRVSNFGNEGPAPVGSHPGMSDFGNFDMAGNVKEWAYNSSGRGRYILGGAWGEPSYLFRVELEHQPPFSREPTHGFRCSRYADSPPEELLGPAVPSYAGRARDEKIPVADEVFDAYRRAYAYDPSDLEATVDSVDESSPHWRRETVSFKAAYGGERVLMHLFLPRNAEPPYQAVIWFPGNDVFIFPVGGGLASEYLFDFIPRSGRALVHPVYKGTYERYMPFSFAPNEWRDMMIMWSKDLGRTIDYLEDRPDIDERKLAYYGFSAGAFYAPVFTAVDDRFAASVLLGGGLIGDIAPEMDPVNFAPRSRVPTLMVNGEHDFLVSSRTAQEPLFELLGAPADQKRHARLAGGDIPSDRLAIIEEVLSWLDRFLGPVGEAVTPSR